MRIGHNWWISDFDGYKEVELAYNNGSRLASSVTFSHEVNDNGTIYYCFLPDNRMVDGCIYVTEDYIKDVFKLLGATVNVNFMDNKFTFTSEKLTINDNKSYKYKYDDEFTYKLQKTQYKGGNAYSMVCMLVDPFWHNMMENAFKAAKYID